MKSALITGITGQDGSFLAELLLRKGYKVYGAYRRLSTPNFWRLQYLDIIDKINLIPIDIIDSASIGAALQRSQPSEVYNLAAQSFVGVSFDQPLYTSEVTGLGTLRMLDEIRKFDDKIKFYQASSSEMFGNEKTSRKNEKTSFNPASPYAIAKVFSHNTANMYKESYGMFCTNGILFNHESPLRGLEFVTRKVSNGIAKISLGIEKNLRLGNLSSIRDWGYAPEYVEGMYLMMKQKKPDNFVLATDESHSINELVNEACKIGGISTKAVISSKGNFRVNDVEHLQGDYKKAKKQLGWNPKTKFKKLIKIMVEEDLSRWERYLKKEVFPWDAFTAGGIYPKTI